MNGLVLGYFEKMHPSLKYTGEYTFLGACRGAHLLHKLE
jgi:hypothetical protein